MSYCRWSSDNWKCELYCYEHCDGGWTTHVAGLKHKGEIPDDRWDDFIEGRITPEEYTDLHKKQMDAVEAGPLVPIGLAHDGETFSDPTLEDFKARLLYLRGVGYRFPDYVIEAVDEEIAELRTREGGAHGEQAVPKTAPRKR